MRPEDILNFLRQQPFQPFQMTLTDGRTYEVRHPELAMVGFTTVNIGLAAGDRAEPIYDRFVILSLAHIMQIEPLQPTAK